jgi:integrase
MLQSCIADWHQLGIGTLRTRLPLRANELFALRVDDLEQNGLRIDESVWEGNFGAPKTAKSIASVRLPAALQTGLFAYSRSLKDSSPKALLFPGRNGKVWRANNFLNRILKPAAARAGLEGVTIQSLRRTAATHLAQRATIGDTKSQMRHSNPATTLGYYVQSLPASLGVAVESFASEVNRAVNVLNVFERVDI